MPDMPPILPTSTVAEQTEIVAQSAGLGSEKPRGLRTKETPNAQRPTPNIQCGIKQVRHRARRGAAERLRELPLAWAVFPALTF